MTAVANLLMNSQGTNVPKVGQNSKAAGDRQFGALVEQSITSEKVQIESLLDSEKLPSDQLIKLLEEFRNAFNAENGTDLSLGELIDKLQSQLSPIVLQQILPSLTKGIDKTMPILDPLHKGSYVHLADVIKQGSIQTGADTPALTNRTDAIPIKGNALQEFVKFLGQKDAQTTLPVLNNLKQLLTDLKGKLSGLNSQQTSLDTNNQNQVKGTGPQQLFFQLKNSSFKTVDAKSGLETTVQPAKPEVSTSGLFSSTSSSVMSKVEQFILHTPKDQSSTSQFINDFSKIINRGRLLTLPNGSTQLTVKLFPENLGQLDIQIVQRNGEIAAKIIASTVQAKDLIESNLNQLRHSLHGQNINVDKIEISNHQHDWMSGKQEREEKQSSEEQQEQGQEQHEPEQQSSFEELLKEMGFNEEV